MSVRSRSWGVFTGVFLALLVVFAPALPGQSTQSAFLGQVQDSSKAAVAGAEVRITNVEEGVTRSVETDANGNYYAPDFKPGRYKIEVVKAGFRTEVATDVPLAARQELREDFTLTIGEVTQTVEVQDTSAGAINTETPAISGSLDAQSVIDLPANYRAGGSTSPLKLVQALPGVQPDSSGKYSVQGGLPFMSETSVDGISTQNVSNNNPLSDAWPSAESITELRVDGVGNNAEFGQPGAITSVTKSGTNDLHGGLFWYHQNRALDATAYGQLDKPQKIGNDFGITAGGPVWLPHLYNGRNKSFFFATYEGFRFPLQESIQNTVPTQAMRDGDFSNVYSTVNNNLVKIAPLKDPYTGGSYGYTLPSVSSIASKFLALYPLPNVGDPNIFTGQTNYIANADNSYNSNQFDIRGDQYFGQKWQIMGRFSWKNISQAQPTILLLPSSQYVDQYRMLATSVTYNFKPNLANEFRFGFTRNNSGNTNPFDGKAFVQTLGLTGIANNNLYFNGLTELDFNNVTSLGVDRLSSINKSNVYQYTDNLRWTHGRHSFKFGGDIRHIQAISPLGFNGADNYGTYTFSEALFTGYDVADFELGIPSTSFYDTVSQDNDGVSTYYNFYAQDTFQATSRLTLSLGLRYEYHPGYQDQGKNIGNFNPEIPGSGEVVYPDGGANLLNPGFLANFNACPLGSKTGPEVNGVPCTPVLSASQAGLPNSLRTADKLRFMPRLGIAYRPFNNDRTAIRAGIGAYNVTTLGRIFYSLTGTLQAGTQSFNNVQTPTGPEYAWPDYSAGGSGYGAPQYGTDYFGTANDIHFHDPYATQWSVSVDHELGAGVALRASYIGMRVNHLVWAPSYNDMTYSSTTTALDPTRLITDRPFPNWGIINNRASSANSMYNAFQLEANRRFRNGLSFNSTYTLAKNMADNQAHQQSFADENGGSRATYYFDRSLDYGPVYGTRRHRWITTALYDLPFGRGRTFGKNVNKAVDTVFGGWRLSNIFLIQSGAFITPYFDGGDPSGTGSGIIDGRDQYPDRVGGWVPSNQNANNWIDANAFVCPGIAGWTPGSACPIGTNSTNLAPIGRFGNSRPGSITGPGMVNLSSGLSKEFLFTERLRLKAGATFTNVLNHANLADPNLDITSGGFGQISSARGADFGGYRTGQVFLRLDF
ncbi:MAG TPA: TonB-dependent receptor [Dongiaceae bacterium]|nr:TonB-dependent receptor [Dongiaceae bacterium]